MPSTLFPFKVKFVLYFTCEKNKNKQKEAGFGPFLKNRHMLDFLHLRTYLRWWIDRCMILSMKVLGIVPFKFGPLKCALVAFSNQKCIVPF